MNANHARPMLAFWLLAALAAAITSAGLHESGATVAVRGAPAAPVTRTAPAQLVLGETLHPGPGVSLPSLAVLGHAAAQARPAVTARAAAPRPTAARTERTRPRATAASRPTTRHRSTRPRVVASPSASVRPGHGKGPAERPPHADGHGHGPKARGTSGR